MRDHWAVEPIGLTSSASQCQYALCGAEWDRASAMYLFILRVLSVQAGGIRTPYMQAVLLMPQCSYRRILSYIVGVALPPLHARSFPLKVTPAFLLYSVSPLQIKDPRRAFRSERLPAPSCQSWLTIFPILLYSTPFFYFPSSLHLSPRVLCTVRRHVLHTFCAQPDRQAYSLAMLSQLC